MLGKWIITDNGDVLPEGAPALMASFRTSRRGVALNSFLVDQMGFVAIAERRTRVELTFNPAIVSPIALTSYFYWAGDRPYRPTACIDPTNAKLSMLHHRQKQLQFYLGDIIEQRAPRPDFSTQPIELDRSPFAKFWRVAREICNADLVSTAKLDMIEQLFSGHFIIAERGHDGDYRLMHAGRSLHEHDPDSVASLSGKSFRESYDRRFGIWSADHFRSITPDCSPRAEAVNAIIAWHRHSRRRYFYDRLIMPMKASSGNDALLVAVHRF